jgi:hypothetical protein
MATATVNTYSFTQSGYFAGNVVFSGGPGTLSGAFTGTLNALGQFQASDLSAFSMVIFFPTDTGPVTGDFNALGDLSLFSFNTDHAGDLVIVAQNGVHQTTCVGAAATLFPACNPGGLNPAGILGDLLVQGIEVTWTTQAPVITLVSSVSTPPPGVPEPSTWAMMLVGFALIGGALRCSPGRKQRRRA